VVAQHEARRKIRAAVSVASGANSASRDLRPPERRPLHSRVRKSTRQCCRIEFALTPSKQRIGASATRQFLGDFFSPIFEFRISSFVLFRPEKGVNQIQVFRAARHSKQTPGTRKGCQFFAKCFSVRKIADHAALKTAALHSSLPRSTGKSACATKTTATPTRGTASKRGRTGRGANECYMLYVHTGRAGWCWVEGCGDGGVLPRGRAWRTIIM